MVVQTGEKHFPRHKNICIIIKCTANRLVKQQNSSKPAGALLAEKLNVETHG